MQSFLLNGTYFLKTYNLWLKKCCKFFANSNKSELFIKLIEI